MIEFHKRQEWEWRLVASLAEDVRRHRRIADFDAACLKDFAAQEVYRRLRRDARSGVVPPMPELRLVVEQNQVDDHGTEAAVDRCMDLLARPYRDGEFLYVVNQLQGLRELEILRQGGEWLTQAVERATSGQEVDREAIESVRSGILDKLRPSSTLRQTESLPDVLERIIDLDGDPDAVSRVPAFRTGFAPLDAHTGGIRRGEMWVVAARTGVGKTHFAVQMSDRVSSSLPTRADDDLRGRVFTVNLEMTSDELARRALAHRSKVGAKAIEDKLYLRDRKLRAAIVGAEESIARERGFSDYDTLGSITPTELEAQVRKMHAYRGLDFLVVDYIGLVKRAHKSTRAEEIGEIAMLLKALAKDLKIGVLVVAQINRQGADGEVELHHLKDSGDIEQAADGVVMLIENGSAAGFAPRGGAFGAKLARAKGNPIEDAPCAGDEDGPARPPWVEQVRVALKKCRRAQPREWTANFVKATSTIADTDEYETLRPLDWGLGPAPGMWSSEPQATGG